MNVIFIQRVKHPVQLLSYIESWHVATRLESTRNNIPEDVWLPSGLRTTKKTGVVYKFMVQVQGYNFKSSGIFMLIFLPLFESLFEWPDKVDDSHLKLYVLNVRTESGQRLIKASIILAAIPNKRNIGGRGTIDTTCTMSKIKVAAKKSIALPCQYPCPDNGQCYRYRNAQLDSWTQTGLMKSLQ